MRRLSETRRHGKLSPIMRPVQNCAAGGGVVVGFGRLSDAPGPAYCQAMLINRSCKYVCRLQRIAVESTKSALTCGFQAADALLLPIAHRWGNCWVDDGTLERMEHAARSFWSTAIPAQREPEDRRHMQRVWKRRGHHGSLSQSRVRGLGSTDGVGAVASIASWVEKVRTGRNGRSAPSGRSKVADVACATDTARGAVAAAVAATWQVSRQHDRGNLGRRAP